MTVIVHLLAGLIFGAGLIVSGMADPAKVLNFLDVTGTWDPSLAFVMGGAVVVTTAGYWLIFRRKTPVFDEAFHLPAATEIDRSLIVGAAIFGIGWGLVGFCPGPALVSVTLAAPGTLAFLPAMFVGIAAALWLRKPRRTTQDA